MSQVLGLPEYIAICCTETDALECLDFEDVERREKAYGKFRCGYHYVITRDGDVHVGRDISERANAVHGWNDVIIAICLVGGWNRWGDHNYEDAQLDSLAELVNYLQETFPEAKPVAATHLNGCGQPGFNVTKWWEQYER